MTLACGVHDHVATITITNPAKRNAMTPAMWRELPRLLGALATDPAVRALVLTGAGDTFCSGADISALTEIGTDGGSLTIAADQALAAFPKPTIAAIRGHCLGGGLQLATACDLRIAADTAYFGITAAKLGIVYPATSTARLIDLVGPATTKALLFTGDLINAPNALRIDLIEERTRAWLHQTHTSREADEGISAFLERRSPAFTWTGPLGPAS
jgi:enoyl-CoA hydratase/carnithine racemase